MKNYCLTTLAAVICAAGIAQEQLDRGVVALSVASGSGNFVSWRMLATDDEDLTRFDILRNGVNIAKDQYKTNYVDRSGAKTSKYQIVTKVNGEPVDTSAAVQAWGAKYKEIQLNRPADGITKPYTTTIDKETVSFPNGQPYSYSPNDMSVGDVDGDGQYELFVKWDPSNSKDNSQNGVTGIVYIDCYRLDGTQLWRIDLGKNIRAGAHYTQFMVYDFDGDGRAELMCKTAPGSLDGQGQYVNQASDDATIKAASNTKDWVSEGAGRVNGGHEYLTVFEGLTGRAINTIAYNPNRNATSTLSDAAGTFNWGVGGKNDTGSYGNRGERYLAAVAHIDGTDRPACGIFSRGYYDYAFIWAVAFDGQRLIPRWLSSHKAQNTYSLTTYDADGHATTKSYGNCRPTRGSGSGTMYQNGNHNLSIADVDGDGCDEIIWGSAGLDHDGTLLYGTGFGHGDAIHLSDLNPERPGLEVFQVHEEKGEYAWDVHDARTGEILFKGGPEGVDNGRGMAAQLDATHHGFYFSSASERQQRSAVTGSVASTGQTSLNFRIYWDDNLQDELLDGNKLDKWANHTTSRLVTFYDIGPGSTCNGTKNTPNLQADILGDWREEVILHDGESRIAIYSTNIETKFRMPTLMHDHTYRMGVCWQNTAYNQPPHLGYFLPDAMQPRLVGDTQELTLAAYEEMEPVVIRSRYASTISQAQYLLPDGTKMAGLPAGLQKTIDYSYKTLTLSGTPTEPGDYRLIVSTTGLNSESRKDTISLHVVASQGIAATAAPFGPAQSYDLTGRPVAPAHSSARHPQFIITRRQDGTVVKALNTGR